MEKTERQKNHDEIIDKIFGKMDRLFREGKFEEAGEVLRKVDVQEQNTTILIAWLVAAHWTHLNGDQDRVPGIAEFIARAADEIKKREPDRWKSLLQGFRV